MWNNAHQYETTVCIRTIWRKHKKFQVEGRSDTKAWWHEKTWFTLRTPWSKRYGAGGAKDWKISKCSDIIWFAWQNRDFPWEAPGDQFGIFSVGCFWKIHPVAVWEDKETGGVCSSTAVIAPLGGKGREILGGIRPFYIPWLKCCILWRSFLTDYLVNVGSFVIFEIVLY